MFSDKTCLILGAGASRPYGFPTSGELRELLLGGPESWEVFRDLGFQSPEQTANFLEQALLSGADGDPKSLQRFRNVFSESERISIDALLASLPLNEQNQRLTTIAKRGMAAALLLCENERRPTGDWYRWLLEFILRNGRDFPGSRLSVITFNYDRSLEQFLWKAFLRSFDLEPVRATEMLNRIEIVHAYGSLGPLTLHEHNDPVDYGDVSHAARSGNLLCPVAPRTPVQSTNQIRKIFAESKRLIFLGFGFWPENIDLLFGSNYQGRHYQEESYEIENERRIFASRFKLSASVVDEVNDRIGTVIGEPLIEWGEKNETIWEFVHGRQLTL